MTIVTHSKEKIKVSTALLTVNSAIALLIFASSALAQVSPEDHAKHHPGSATTQMPATQGSPAPGNAKSGGMGGMMDGMGEMMKGMMEGMGAPKQKELYPSLMELPELSEQKRSELESKAHERMQSGSSLFDQGVEELGNATEESNFLGIRDSAAKVREGLAQIESGAATLEALNNSEPPQAIGLKWFKGNLGLSNQNLVHMQTRTLFGLSFFHGFIMLLLIGFAGAMIAMYFFKMKRALALLSRLEANGVTPQTSLVSTAPSPLVSPSPEPASTPNPNLTRPWRGKLKVASIYQETPTVKTFKLVSPDGGDLPFTYLAGQFLTLAVTIDGKPVKRAYTISSHPCDHKALEVTIKREENGLVSRYLHDLIREGDLIEIDAAYGHLTFSGVGGEGIVLIGGGVGITPLMSVLRCLIACGMKNDIHLLYACKSLDDLVFRDELQLLIERNPNFKILVAVDKLQGSFPGAFEGRLTKEKIKGAVPGIAGMRVHLCGPPGMMQAMRTALTELNVPEEQIKTEAFGPAKSTPQKAAAASATVQPTTELKSVVFKKSGKALKIHEKETVLELAETSGIDIPYSCRVGTCGVCKVKLLSGEVSMDVQDALSDVDKKSGLILACQAKAKTNLEIEEP